MSAPPAFGRIPLVRHPASIAAAVLLLALGVRLVTQTYSVQSSSMEPTLLPGDHVVVLRYVVSRPGRGHVVVLDDGDGRTLIKRVIGLPGDSVRIAEGRVFVNGEPLGEAYARASSDAAESIHVVPREHLFLLGDNRDHSEDSRAIGFVLRDALVGRARLVYWSVSPDAARSTRWARVMRTFH